MDGTGGGLRGRSIESGVEGVRPVRGPPAGRSRPAPGAVRPHVRDPDRPAVRDPGPGVRPRSSCRGPSTGARLPRRSRSIGPRRAARRCPSICFGSDFASRPSTASFSTRGRTGCSVVQRRNVTLSERPRAGAADALTRRRNRHGRVADRSVDGAAPSRTTSTFFFCATHGLLRPTAAFRTTSSTCSWEMPTSALRVPAVAPVVHGG